MGRYGVNIKNPSFEGIGYDYKNDDIDEQLMVEKAKLCSIFLNLDKQTGHFYNTNDIKYIVNYIKQLLVIKYRKQYEGWVENGILYIDDVRQNTSEYEIEDSINNWEKIILSDLEMLYIAALMNPKYFTTEIKDDRKYNLDIYDIIDGVRCDINRIIDSLEESISTYVGYLIVQKNFDNIIPDKELTLEDLKPVNEELENEE